MKQRSGVVLSPEKDYLIQQRLSALREGSFPDLCQRLRNNDGSLTDKVVAALTTHESSFFRDEHPFTTLAEHFFPQWRKLGRPIKIWSAASSSGQEPYSLAMLWAEQGGRPGQLSIRATDIDLHIVEQAKQGLFNDTEIRRGLNDERRSRWFQQQGKNWQIDRSLRSAVTFDVWNLLDGVPAGPFDLILCRNVLIYFDQDFRSDCLGKMAAQLHPEGALMLGSSEHPYPAHPGLKAERIGRTTFYTPT